MNNKEHTSGDTERGLLVPPDDFVSFGLAFGLGVTVRGIAGTGLTGLYRALQIPGWYFLFTYLSVCVASHKYIILVVFLLQFRLHPIPFVCFLHWFASELH